MWNYLLWVQNLGVDSIQDLIDAQGSENESTITELEVFMIETILRYYETAKEASTKYYYDYSIHNYMINLVRILFKMKIDAFLGDKDFYKNFLKDHLVWLEEVLKVSEMKESMLKGTEDIKWRSLALLDYSKLESVRTHKDIIEHWKEFKIVI